MSGLTSNTALEPASGEVLKAQLGRLLVQEGVASPWDGVVGRQLTHSLQMVRKQVRHLTCIDDLPFMIAA